jgi:hypothetical protein
MDVVRVIGIALVGLKVKITGFRQLNSGGNSPDKGLFQVTSHRTRYNTFDRDLQK